MQVCKAKVIISWRTLHKTLPYLREMYFEYFSRYKKNNSIPFLFKIMFVILRTTNIILFLNKMAYTLSNDYKEEEINLARFAKAMGHPARIAILRHLASLNTCCFGDIDKRLPIAKATISQHLSELKDAGLIQGSIEPPKVIYCIDKKNWKAAKKLFASIFENTISNKDETEPKCCR